METDELIPTERVAIVMYRLMRGERLTTADVARMTGLTHDGAYKLLGRVSRVVPLVQAIDCWYMDSYSRYDCAC